MTSDQPMIRCQLLLWNDFRRRIWTNEQYKYWNARL